MKKLFLSIVSVMTAVALMVFPALAAVELDGVQAKEGNRNLRATEQNEVLSMSREIENPIRFEIPCAELNLMQYTNDDTPKQGKEIFLDLFLYSHGIAVLTATGKLSFDKRNLENMLQNFLSAYVKQEKEKAGTSYGIQSLSN